MQPMTSMKMAPSGMSCQQSSKKNCGGSSKGKDNGSCNQNNGAGNANGNVNDGNNAAAGTTYLKNVQEAIQQGQMPSANALMSNLPFPAQSPQGQQLLNQTVQLLSQAGEPGKQRANELIKLAQAQQGQQGQQTSPTLLTDKTSGGLKSVQGNSDTEQLVQAIYAVFSQLFQALKSQGYTPGTTQKV